MCRWARPSAGTAIRVKTTELEAQFVKLLETLQPKAEFMQLFRAIVVDVWKERSSQAKRLQVRLIRSRGHFLKGRYDVHNGRYPHAASAPTVHG